MRVNWSRVQAESLSFYRFIFQMTLVVAIRFQPSMLSNSVHVSEVQSSNQIRYILARHQRASGVLSYGVLIDRHIILDSLTQYVFSFSVHARFSVMSLTETLMSHLGCTTCHGVDWSLACIHVVVHEYLVPSGQAWTIKTSEVQSLAIRYTTATRSIQVRGF